MRVFGLMRSTLALLGARLFGHSTKAPLVVAGVEFDAAEFLAWGDDHELTIDLPSFLAWKFRHPESSYTARNATMSRRWQALADDR